MSLLCRRVAALVVPTTRYSLALQATSRRLRSTNPARNSENINVGHSRFLAESSARAKWNENSQVPGNGGLDSPGEDFDTLPEEKGKLSPTSSHLFKLILPLDRLQPGNNVKGTPPTVFLLHPSQPLSHIRRLILSELAPPQPTISFRSTSPKGRHVQWSESTDIGDFIRDAARATEFQLHVKDGDKNNTLSVEVPSFADRTRFLRRRLAAVEVEIHAMEALKKRCDAEAHRGARRMAVGGLGMLVVYWGTVARLTFWDLGWDVMEPVTYLSGLSMVILGYLWFLYQGREVSYSSVLDRSISTRRQALYKEHGFDIERWADLMAEAKGLRREIAKIAEDYEGEEETEERSQDEGNPAEEAEAVMKDFPEVSDTPSQNKARD